MAIPQNKNIQQPLLYKNFMKVNYRVFKYVIILLIAIFGLTFAYQAMSLSSVSQNMAHGTQESSETLSVKEPKSDPNVMPTVNAWWDDSLVREIVILVGVSVCILLAVWLYTKINAPPLVRQTKLEPDEKVLQQWHNEAMSGNSQLLEKLYNSYDININVADKDGITALAWSTGFGHLPCVKYLIGQGADIHAADENGNTPLLWSAEYGHLDCIKYLIGQGADIHAADENGETALVLARKADKQDVVTYLSEAVEVQQQWFPAAKAGNSERLAALHNDPHIHVNTRDAEENTALLWSATYGRLACVKYLVGQGADIKHKNKRGNTALLWSAAYGHLACVKYLVGQGADIKHKNRQGNTALLWSAYQGHLACLKYLVGQGADIKHKNNYEATALLCSAFSGKLACVKYLLQQGANIRARDKNGETALQLAAAKSKQDVVDFLSKAADAQKQWFEAAERGDRKSLEKLHNEYSINVNTRDKDENTALLFSAYKGRLDCVKYLLQQGANIHEKTEDGATNLLLSAYNGKLACVKYLVKKGANIHAKDKNGQTALIWSAEQGHIDVVRLLVSRGADVYATNNDEKTALKFAQEANQTDVVDYLSSKYALWYDAYLLYSINFLLKK